MRDISVMTVMAVMAVEGGHALPPAVGLGRCVRSDHVRVQRFMLIPDRRPTRGSRYAAAWIMAEGADARGLSCATKGVGLTCPTAPTAPTESPDSNAQYLSVSVVAVEGGHALPLPWGWGVACAAIRFCWACSRPTRPRPVAPSAPQLPIFRLDDLDALVGSFRVSRGQISSGAFPHPYLPAVPMATLNVLPLLFPPVAVGDIRPRHFCCS